MDQVPVSRVLEAHHDAWEAIFSPPVLHFHEHENAALLLPQVASHSSRGLEATSSVNSDKTASTNAAHAENGVRPDIL